MSLADFDSGLASTFSSGGGPSSPIGGSLDENSGANAELQQFIAMEQQKQQLRATVILILKKGLLCIILESNYLLNNYTNAIPAYISISDPKPDGHVLGKMCE